MVIFGGGGDLTKRLLVPALYNLSRTGLLPEHFAIVGVDAVDQDVAAWSKNLREMLESFIGNAASESRIDAVDDTAWQRLADGMSYMKGDFNDPGLLRKAAHAPARRGAARSRPRATCCSTSPSRTASSARSSKNSGMPACWTRNRSDDKPQRWRRVVIEKPFGHDLESARALNTRIRRVLREEQIYRIDHFLGKETVQSIMALRFANGLFEPIWNRDRIDHVQITAAETVGVERRGKFYEATGALRDMVPNHVFQLLAMVAMEPPSGFDADAVRNRKADVFAAMGEVKPRDAVRGQYGPGTVMGRPGPWLSRGTRRRARIRAPRPSWPCGWHRQLALGRRAVLRAHRQAPRTRVTEIAIHFKPRPMRRSTTPRSRRCRRTGWCCTSSRTRACPCNSR